MRAVALLLLLSACGEGAEKEAVADVGTVSVAMQSEDAIDGRRPVLTLSCGPAGASFWLELVREPAPPPRARGEHGTIKLDDRAPQRVPLLWLGADKWAPEASAMEESSMVRSMLGARSIYFLGPEGTTERAYRWDTSRLGASIEELRRACG